MDVKTRRIGIVAAALLFCLASEVRARPELVVVERFSRCQSSAGGAANGNAWFTDTCSSDEHASSGTGAYVSLAPNHTYRFRIWNIGLSVESGESGCDLTGNVDISAP